MRPWTARVFLGVCGCVLSACGADAGFIGDDSATSSDVPGTVVGDAPASTPTMPDPSAAVVVPSMPSAVSAPALPQDNPIEVACAADGELELGARPAAFVGGYGVPMRVHTGHSTLDRDELCRVVQEVNVIWWLQAGICFEIDVVSHDEPSSTGFDLWFLERVRFGDGREVNGVYLGDHSIYSSDYPSLAIAENPTRHPAARTAAHELGHGLGLAHQDCGSSCDELLMRSGFRGFQLVSGEPADTDEVQQARAAAVLEERSGGRLGEPLAAGQACAEAVFRD